MRQFEKPRIFISKCLGQDHCRFDGGIIISDAVEGLAPFVDIITVCPEMGIGLPAPREALRIIRNDNNEDRLVFSLSGTDKTDEMLSFSTEFLEKLTDEDIDGFILKHRSPSCGINDVKIYKGIGKSNVIPGKTTGFFGRSVEQRFPHIPLETESRLLNFNIREHFMIRVFMMRDFKRVKRSAQLPELIRFHSINKYLLMAFSQRYLSTMGRIVANHEGLPLNELISSYENNLMKALDQPLSVQRNINVLLHVFGYFKRDLSSDEKAFFLENLELYNQKRVPFSVLLGILKSWIIRFDDSYLKDQTLFEPFPAALFEVTDSGKGL